VLSAITTYLHLQEIDNEFPAKVIGMDMVIVPYQSVGPLSFGMAREEVRSIINSAYKVVKKTEQAEAPYDYFYELGIHVHYSKEGQCEFIELGAPSRPLFLEHELLGQPFHLVYAWLKTISQAMRLSMAGVTSLDLGISLYVPGLKDNPRAPVESISAFARGYWD
jgi:hypothetical protein